MTARHLLMAGSVLAAGLVVATAAHAGDSDSDEGARSVASAPAPQSGAQQPAAPSFMPKAAAEHARLASIGSGKPQQPKLYTSPARSFQIAVPGDARLESRNNGEQIAIQSRRGFALNLQTADTNPKITLEQMVGRLDHRYLGDDKPWSAKLSQRRLTIHGLPAIEAVYAGGSTKVQAIVVRGKQTDFVFLFFAPAMMFKKFESEFSWILDNFHASPEDMGVADNQRPGDVEAAMTAASQAPRTPAAAAETASAAATAPAANDATPAPNANANAGAKTAPTTASTQRFAAPGFGYVIQYPQDWTVEKSASYSALFSGRKGTPAYDAIVSVQNVRAGKDQQNANAAAVLRTLEQQLGQGAQDLRIVGEKRVTYDRGGVRLEGRQFVAEYRHAGQVFRKWALVLPRPDGTVTHVWSYTAPRAAFDTYRPVAEGMLRSWTISENRGPATRG